MTTTFTHVPGPLPQYGPLGVYNDCLAKVKEQIRIMASNNANLQWLNEMQHLINSARQKALDSNYYNEENREYYDGE